MWWKESRPTIFVQLVTRDSKHDTCWIKSYTIVNCKWKAGRCWTWLICIRQIYDIYEDICKSSCLWFLTPNCILKITFAVNGGWTRWSPFTPCTTTCGVGYQTSTRTCTNPSPQFGGQTCTGNNNDTRVCPNQPLCPGNFIRTITVHF